MKVQLALAVILASLQQGGGSQIITQQQLQHLHHGRTDFGRRSQRNHNSSSGSHYSLWTSMSYYLPEDTLKNDPPIKEYNLKHHINRRVVPTAVPVLSLSYTNRPSTADDIVVPTATGKMYDLIQDYENRTEREDPIAKVEQLSSNLERYSTGIHTYNQTQFGLTTEDPSIPENPMGLEDPTLLLQEWEEEPTVRITKATFKGENGSQVHAQTGTTADIPCVIMNRADHETVSWIRLRDHSIITVGRQTYSNDDRFSVTFNRHKQEWTLHLRYAHPRDAGEYVCQLSTHPPMVFLTTLDVTQAEAEIEGGPDRYVQEGSAVVLTCKLRYHSKPPMYIFWYHNRKVLNFNSDRQMTVELTQNGSTLTLGSVNRTDSGNYTCSPSNARPASLILHIISGDAPAAVQVSAASVLYPFNHLTYYFSWDTIRRWSIYDNVLLLLLLYHMIPYYGS